MHSRRSTRSSRDANREHRRGEGIHRGWLGGGRRRPLTAATDGIRSKRRRSDPSSPAEESCAQERRRVFDIDQLSWVQTREPIMPARCGTSDLYRRGRHILNTDHGTTIACLRRGLRSGLGAKAMLACGAKNAFRYAPRCPHRRALRYAPRRPCRRAAPLRRTFLTAAHDRDLP
jgi:hypothetical protein